MQVLKLAFADREAYVGDPAHVDVPVEGLLSKSMRPCGVVSSIPTRPRQCIHRVIPARCWPWRRTIGRATAPTLEPVGGDADGTTYLATVDAQGNMVSATPSSFAGLAGDDSG